MYFVGLDVGSTTVKAVVESAVSHEIVWRDYQRHAMRQQEMVLEFLLRMEKEAGVVQNDSRFFITGSGGHALADLIGAKYVQEVTAISLAVESLCPDVNSVIELGGQDAKVIIFREDMSTGKKRKVPSMNDKCAAGTGAVIDKIAAKLGVPSDQLWKQTYDDRKLYPVAAKCGVFAETDINGLQKQGVPQEDLMASLFNAIVLQNLTVLTRGYVLRPNVLLLGGPNRFILGLQQAWRFNIPRMWGEFGHEVPADRARDELIKVPKDAEYFGALGAVEFGRAWSNELRYRGTQLLNEYVSGAREHEKRNTAIAGLCASDAEVSDFRAQYEVSPFTIPQFSKGEIVEVFAGIDGGSTSTKAVLLSREGDVLAKAYQLSNGNPLEDAKEVFSSLRQQVESQGAEINILGVATTGYAKDILADVLQADVAVAETVAHAKSATWFYRDPHVIVDVGGQDIKVILLREGVVRDFRLNTQCSAGNGYFLQTTAEQLGIPVARYADVALSARMMPQFGYGCAVFLQSDVVNFQRQGWTKSEILAGLAAVLPKNVFLYVAGYPNVATLGSRIILQGGTQKNLAVVKAEVDFIRSHFSGNGTQPYIVVHKHCAESGAIGAALEGSRVLGTHATSSFIGLDALANLRYRSIHDESTRCQFCKNHCLRTFIDVELASNGTSRSRRIIVANCENGRADDVEKFRAIRAGTETIKSNTPNIPALAAAEIWKSSHPHSVADTVATSTAHFSRRRRQELITARSQLRIGIPRVLGLYSSAPLFRTYLEALGLLSQNIIFSEFTNNEMYTAAAGLGSIDPCFPSKVAIAHVYNLLRRSRDESRVDVIFFPMLDTFPSRLVNCTGNACPAVVLTPEAVKATFTKEGDVFAEHGTRFLAPMLDLADRRMFALQMFEAWRSLLGLSAAENDRAVQVAYGALEDFERRMRTRSREVLELLERENRIGIVFLGRPYHHDPGLNQGIPEEFQKRGYPVLSQAYLPIDDDILESMFGGEVRDGILAHPLDITDVWKHPFSANTNQKIWAAKFVARHRRLIGIELSSFKCGHDAPIYSLLRSIIEAAGAPFFAFKDLDENKPAASIKLRVETIDYFLKQRRVQQHN